MLVVIVWGNGPTLFQVKLKGVSLLGFLQNEIEYPLYNLPSAALWRMYFQPD